MKAGRGALLFCTRGGTDNRALWRQVGEKSRFLGEILSSALKVNYHISKVHKVVCVFGIRKDNP